FYRLRRRLEEIGEHIAEPRRVLAPVFERTLELFRGRETDRAIPLERLLHDGAELRVDVTGELVHLRRATFSELAQEIDDRGGAVRQGARDGAVHHHADRVEISAPVEAARSVLELLGRHV